MAEIAERDLVALSYHREVAAYLQEREPEIWAWSRSAEARAGRAAEMRDAMLRQTYRMEPDSHPEVHAACRAAMERLGVDAPATLYQAADGAMNASLCFIPGEVHMVFFGPILERLNAEELLALLGHELAHYRLWTADDGAHYDASRIMDHCLSYPDAARSHRETARLLSLHTELYADRGAAIVGDAVGPAVSTLVKTMTGMPNVDPAAYLRQAGELESSVERSEGLSHPEIFLRATALEKWWAEAPDTDAWIDDKLRGKLSLEGLDLLGQRELARLTRAFLADFLIRLPMASEQAAAQARRFFPDLGEGETPLDPAALEPDRIDGSTRDYLIALMFDLAMADADLRDEILQVAAARARDMDAAERFAAALKRDLKWTKTAADRLVAKSAKAA